MSLSGDIQDIINNTLPITIHCDGCDRDIDISELLSNRELRQLAEDILRAVVDELEK